MRTTLSAMGRAFLRAFAAALLTYSFGILAAPNLDRAYGVGVAALAASIAAGFRVITAYIPQLSFADYFGDPLGNWIDAFFHAGVGALIVGLTGWLGAPELSTWRATLTGIVVGALAAGAHALQDVGTVTKRPAPARGIAEPPKP